jgi:hypothetical protein
MYQTGRPLPKIEEEGKSWLRRPKLYKGFVEPYKKKSLAVRTGTFCSNFSFIHNLFSSVGLAHPEIYDYVACSIHI